MYLLEFEPTNHNTSDDLIPLLEKICKVEVTDTGNGFSVSYQLNYCQKVTSPISYSNEYTKLEVYNLFYREQVIKIARRNGFVLFKSVDS